jgi:hypothetical protein
MKLVVTPPARDFNLQLLSSSSCTSDTDTNRHHATTSPSAMEVAERECEPEPAEDDERAGVAAMGAAELEAEPAQHRPTLACNTEQEASDEVQYTAATSSLIQMCLRRTEPVINSISHVCSYAKQTIGFSRRTTSSSSWTTGADLAAAISGGAPETKTVTRRNRRARSTTAGSARSSWRGRCTSCCTGGTGSGSRSWSPRCGAPSRG